MIEYLPLVLTGLGLTASIVYYANVLSNANKTQQMQLDTRQAQLFMPLFETYRNPDFRKLMIEIQNQSWDTVEEFIEKYGREANPDAFANRTALASYFDGIGVLLKKDLVDIGMVNDLIGNSIISIWERLGEVFINTRKRVKNLYIYNDFEYLYNQIIKHRQEYPM